MVSIYAINNIGCIILHSCDSRKRHFRFLIRGCRKILIFKHRKLHYTKLQRAIASYHTFLILLIVSRRDVRYLDLTNLTILIILITLLFLHLNAETGARLKTRAKHTDAGRGIRRAVC